MGAFRGRWMMVGAVTAVLLAGLPGGRASARKGPKVFSARINARQLVAHGRRTFGTYDGSIFLFAGSKPGGLHGTTRAASFACIAIGLDTSAFPLTLTCGGDYAEERIKGPVVKTWASLHGIQVTIQSFDGTHASGTFAGSLEITSGNAGPLAPAPVENGRFSVAVSRSH
jgi:hypothetical protein